MKFVIDTDAQSFAAEGVSPLPLYSTEGFRALSELWVKVGWNQKYTYTFSWLGRPIIQLPEDLLRIQEVIHRVRPDVIVETGVAHGGSLVFYASLFKAMESGRRVIGVDIEIRPHNREAIEAHPLSPLIELVEGGSTDPATVARVRAAIRPGDKVLVVLDSAHDRRHVRRELDAYHSLVTPGSYIVATDGVMSGVADVPRGKPGWKKDNPSEAAADFARDHPEFELAQPPWDFNESELRDNVTHWPGAWLRRKD
ncbi:MAG TPA: CmcI family methyltransferase [Thermoanaerobaculia bacterium]|jgi:cephalosporin hydroxylase|nr:CmcI family methyltransferase [Thermoanaerobaculia bacterium]